MEKRSRPFHDIFDSDFLENQNSYQKIDRYKFESTSTKRERERNDIDV